MDLLERLKQPTPRFFRKVRNMGIAFTTIGGAVIGLPGLMPPMLTTLAGYLIVAGTVASVVAQTVINDQNDSDGGNVPNVSTNVNPITPYSLEN